MWKTFIGNFDFGHRIGIEYLSLEHTNLILFNTKQGTDLGTLVVSFDQTFHLLHVYCFFNLNMKVNFFGVLPTGKKTEGDSGFDEEKTRKSSSGWQNIKMAFSNKFYPAQHCLLGPLRRPRPMVNKTKNFIFRFFATLYSGKRRETFKKAREIFCTNGEKSFCESILRLLTATLKYNEQQILQI